MGLFSVAGKLGKNADELAGVAPKAFTVSTKSTKVAKSADNVAGTSAAQATKSSSKSSGTLLGGAAVAGTGLVLFSTGTLADAFEGVPVLGGVFETVDNLNPFADFDEFVAGVFPAVLVGGAVYLISGSGIAGVGTGIFVGVISNR